MNIGEMIQNENGSVTGFIAEPTYDFDNVYLEKVVSDNARAPLFDLKTKSPRGRPFRLGSVWERTAKETGECYLGGYIESGVSGFVLLRIFRSKKNPNQLFVVRNLPGDRKRGGATEVSLPEGTAEPARDYDEVFGRELETA
jgi:uncharacterized protein (DUF736 family)